MSFKVLPFAEIARMSKEMIDTALAPIRQRHVKAKAEMTVAKLEEAMVGYERDVHELCAREELNFEAITSKMDAYELAERKVKQIRKLVDDLFPDKKAGGPSNRRQAD